MLVIHLRHLLLLMTVLRAFFSNYFQGLYTFYYLFWEMKYSGFSYDFFRKTRWFSVCTIIGYVQMLERYSDIWS